MMEAPAPAADAVGTLGIRSDVRPPERVARPVQSWPCMRAESTLRGCSVAIGVADAWFGDSVRRTLERDGIRASVHISLVSLLEGLAGERPDACLLDVDLGTTGPEDLAESVRRSAPGLPVLLLSVGLLPLTVPGTGGLRVLPIPIRRTELLAALTRLLEKRGESGMTPPLP